MAQRLVVFVVGPQKTGKTTIANLLADLTESLNSTDYHPTQGVRILECERSIKVSGRGKDVSISVEIWDCSGDPAYLSNWPAVASSASAVLYVCSPDKKQDKELETWHSIFSFLKDPQMMVFAHRNTVGTAKGPRLKLGKPFGRVPIIQTSLDEPEILRGEFDNLLATAYNVHAENREREEQSIIS
ncbi:Intraflagellar transport protein 22 [Chytridiales sp. JEL 0842]|nr:Intraflagellar transport protein 22 [Chytridiales sp. JEL 0842]